MAGSYVDNSFKFHAFFRDTTGNITDFDVPGALATYASSIGDNGEILGSWQDGNNWFGYIRDATGRITSFGAYFFPRGINSTGTMTGSYADAKGRNHGFID